MNNTRNMSNAKPPVDVEALRGHKWEVMASEHDDTLYIMPEGVWEGRGGNKTIAIIRPSSSGNQFADVLAALPELAAEVISRRSRDAAVAKLVEAAAEYVRADEIIGVRGTRLSAALSAYRGGAPE